MLPSGGVSNFGAAMPSRSARDTQVPEHADASRVDAEGLALELREAVEGEVRFDRLSRELYSTDASLYQIRPLGVVVPRTCEDVIRTVEICREYGAPITPRGGGTSLAGQAVGPGVQLDCSKYLTRILEIDAAARTARVEPGVVLDNFNAALAPHGLQFGPDVATSSRANLGGMIANNSSGAHSIIYGKTIDHVLELDVVLADGAVCRLGPVAGETLEQKRALPGLEGRLYRELPALAQRHAAEIEKRFPKVMRRVGGYNIDALADPRGPVNLAQLVVGSEGTLAVVLAAKLKLIALPAAKGLLLVEFDDLFAAVDAVAPIMTHEPAAVELVDKLILDQIRGSAELAPARQMLRGNPGAILIVQFFGDSDGDVADKLQGLERDLKKHRRGNAWTPATDAAGQDRIWELRRAGLGLLMSLKGDSKPYAFVEDTAVRTESLAAYIRRFHQIVAAEGTYAGWYGHASVGCLHVRPVLDLKTLAGRGRLRRIAEQVSDLVLEFGGSFSSEHGDGLARSCFTEKMFGPTLYAAFREVKRCFDPQGLFNPGKITGAQDLLDSLRSPATQADVPEIATRFDFSAEGGMYRAVEMCSGLGHCRKTLSGSMCPSYMATRDEDHSTRGRANALRAALEGRLDGGLNDERLYQVLDLCLGCKACKRECPSAVDMAKLKAEFLDHYQRGRGVSLRTWLFAHVDRLAGLGCFFAPLANGLGSSRPVRWLNDKLLGIDRRRTPPRFVRRGFRRTFRKQSMGQKAGARGEVVLFDDCWMNYCEPQTGLAAVKLLTAAGYTVRLAPIRCCGRPAISAGMLGRAVRLAEANIRALSEHVRAGRPIVGVEPSCLLTLCDEYPSLVSGDLKQQARELAAASQLIEEFLSEQHTADALRFRPTPAKALVHGHCHQKALVGMKPLEALLRRVPRLDLEFLDTSCCGMAGSFGYEREHYDVSEACAERILAPAVRAAAPDAVVLAPGFSCRQQIAHFTGREARHPVEFLAERLESED